MANLISLKFVYKNKKIKFILLLKRFINNAKKKTSSIRFKSSIDRLLFFENTWLNDNKCRIVDESEGTGCDGKSCFNSNFWSLANAFVNSLLPIYEAKNFIKIF